MASDEIVPNQYNVIYKTHVDESGATSLSDRIKQQCSGRAATRQASASGPNITEGVRHYLNIPGLRGCSGTFDSETLATLKADKDIELIEPDTYVYPLSVTTQRNVPSWGLARICRDFPIDTKNPQHMTYVYDKAAAGQGSAAYVIDTGIYLEHNEFLTDGVRRARWGTSIVSGSTDQDFDGHGTAVSSILAGNTFGPAKQAQVVAVKVFPDDKKFAWSSDVIKGLEWAVNDALKNGNILQCVANISLGGSPEIAGQLARAAAVRAGLTIVVAAGNQGVNAETRSSGFSLESIVVGSTRIDDTPHSSSNYGRRLDVYAPGTDIEHAKLGGPSNTGPSTGTSLAAPFVAGVACCLMSNSTGNRGPAKIIQLLRKINSGKDQLKNVVNGSPNLILNNGHHAT